MATDRETTDLAATDLARESLYRFLAAALREPGSAGWQLVLDPESRRLACDAADLLGTEACASPAPLGLGELPPEMLTLRPLCAFLDDPVEDLRADYGRVFGLGTARECPPHETEYHASSEPFFRAQQMADIAGFYRAFGLVPGHTTPERPDHLALELEFMAFLHLKKRLALAGAGSTPERIEGASICDEARRDFFRDHLAWWAPAFATGLRRKAGEGFYAALGQVLAAFLPTERSRFDIRAPRLPVQAGLIERPEEDFTCAGCGNQS